MCTSPIYKVNFPPTMWKMKSNGKIDPRSKFKIIGQEEFEFYCKHDKEMVPNIQTISCGQCMECRIAKTMEWSVRLYCESLMHPKDTCWFITLTYAPENLPSPYETFNRVNFKRGRYASLDKKEVSSFMKNLRNKLGDGIRFFACGEYMPENIDHEPHYHICVFGAKIEDLKFLYAKKGHLYYNSPLVDNCWTFKDEDGHKRLKGWAVISDFSATNAQYTAQYCVKKFIGKKNKDYYELCYSNGVEPLEEEFILMSRRPGIGLNYLEVYKDKLISDKKIYMREGKISQLPKAFVSRIFNEDEQDILSLESEISMAYKKLFTNLGTDKGELLRNSDRDRHLLKMSIGKRNMQ